MVFDGKKARKAVLVAVAAAAVVYAGAMMAGFPRWVVDDAYIILRYAENLAEHGEPTWNLGEDPVEGYTGFAMVGLAALAMKLSIPPVAALHIVGVFSFFAGAALIILLFRGFDPGSVSALVIYLTAPFLYTHAWSGLETTMFASAILFALYAYTLRRRGLFVAALIFLSLTRPEGVLLALILLVLYRPFDLRAVIWYMAPCAIYFLWRWGYYGRILPNTYYAKSSGGDFMPENATMLWEMVKTYLPYPALLALIFVTREKIAGSGKIAAGVAAFGAAVILLYLRSHLVMCYSYRFFVPIFVLALLAVGGILHRTRVTLKSATIIAVLTAAQVSANVSDERVEAQKKFVTTYRDILQGMHIGIGRLLREKIPGDEWLAVHADAGAIPYHSKLRTVDFGRLNDEYLCRLTPLEPDRAGREGEAAGGAGAASGSDVPDSVRALVVDHFFLHEPAAAVFTSYRYQELDHGLEASRIVRDPRFEDYTLVEKFRTRSSNRYFEFLYVRKDYADLFEERSGEARRSARSPTGGREQSSLREDLEDGRREGGGDSEEAPGAGTLLQEFREASSSPRELWELASTAEELWLRIRCWKRIAEDFPDDPGAPEALWQIALHHRSPTVKIESYRSIFQDYPESRHSASAGFMIGFVFIEEMGDTLSGRKALEEAIRRYPESEIAGSARWMLEQLGSG